MTKLIRSSMPVFPREDIDAILRDIGVVLQDGQFRNGKNVALFERLVAQYVNVKDAVAFDSDSSAFETALRYFGVEGKEVVVCTNSFVSVPNSVVAAGGKVVFADIADETLSMDLQSLKRNISPKTCGVIVTHIAGFPNPDLKAILEICRESGLFLVEDATHAIGAIVGGQRVGSFGDAAVFAFTPTKVVTTGEGGMLVTNDAELGAFAKRYRYYGAGVGKTCFEVLGRHMMLPEVSAVLGIYQLKRLDEFIARRNEIAKEYDGALSKVGPFRTIKCPAGSQSSYYKYPLILKSELDKAEFTRYLDDFGVETGSVFYPPCHLQQVYRKNGFASYGGLAAAERVLCKTITLPMHPGLTDQEVDYVIDKLCKFVSKSG